MFLNSLQKSKTHTQFSIILAALFTKINVDKNNKKTHIYCFEI